MISERKPRLSAQRLVSIALPSVLSERSKSTQQRTQRSNSGLSREISLELVARLAPLISSRLPRPDASNSMASVMREGPPVSATIPSASRASGTSAAGTRPTNHRKPNASSDAAAAHSTNAERAARRSSGRGGEAAPCVGRGTSPVSDRTVGISVPPATMIAQNSAARWPRQRAYKALMNRFDGAIDDVARGGRGDDRDQGDLQQYRKIAERADGEAAEQRGKLLAAGRPGEPVAGKIGQREQHDRATAADQSALQSQLQEMPLEMPGDEPVLGADQMQHLDYRAVRHHRGSGRERDREHGGDQNEHEHAEAGNQGRAGHGAHAGDEAAMVVEAGVRHLLGERAAQLRHVRR